ncbi:MAG TPA: carboxypeptidase-like regulatory domain-containing protein [Gemmatimonadaceae bacterium]|nr:carboxypeptidase-like regulatory domain-containing protein [Gemmatimonadaceae bacterium]
MAGRSSSGAGGIARLWPLLVAALGLPTACARDARGDPASSTVARVPDPLRAVARAIAPDGPYRVVRVARPGEIRGVISLGGAPLLRPTALSGDDASVCGGEVPDESVQARGHRLADALVWVSDVHAGRALPRDRRADLAIERCRFVPRVLALVTGTTVNLQSLDATAHHARFYSESEGALIARISTVDRWSVVPSAAIAAEPGLVRVRGTDHPFARGYVAVFDNPYFAVTDRFGRFAIRGLAPGTYDVRIWHERAPAPVDHVVTVKPGQAADLDVELQLQ